MGNADEEGLAAVALEAARLTGVRMVLQVCTQTAGMIASCVMIQSSG
jgi:hypothetical protein